MNVFAFVYHFICRAFGRPNVGKKLYQAAISDLPEKVASTPFLCQYRGRWDDSREENPYGTFMEAPEEELKHSAFEPSPS